MMKHSFKTAILALGLMGSVGSSLAGDVAPVNRGWRPWSDPVMCNLRLDRVYQANQGQPIHAVITNVGRTRLTYQGVILVQQGGRTTSGGSFTVDNANPGERSDRDAKPAFPGLIDGSRVVVQITHCALRN